MSARRPPTLFDLDPPAASDAPPEPPDQEARDFAVDPRHHVVLEASAGTGKTRVLVDRYVRLIVDAGVDPRHVLAITFTRKAAAEMRERIISTFRDRAARGEFDSRRWMALRARLGDIEVSTIDAFCFGLLREFPLEADVNPDFEVADETETGRFAREALDLTFRAARTLITDDERVGLLVTRVKAGPLRSAIEVLLDRRQVAAPALARFLHRRAGVETAQDAAGRFVDRLRTLLDRSAYRLALLQDGPHGVATFDRLTEDLRDLAADREATPAWVQQLRRRLEAYLLTQDGKPRKRLSINAQAFGSEPGRKRHTEAVADLAPGVHAVIGSLEADVSVLLARGLQRLLAVAIRAYESLLDEHGLLDFSGMLDRAVALLKRQEEFARSRLKLQSRYHHLLIDEFQDTSRRQWQLVDLLIAAWAEGEGAAEGRTSIFVVGDRKQSIYRFRHAEATLLEEAARRIAGLRPGLPVRQAIRTSFRAVPELLAFVNALAASMRGDQDLPDRWRFEADDAFPVTGVDHGARRDGQPVLGITAEGTLDASARAVAAEVARLLSGTTVRDRTGAPRAARPDDIAILFRARAGHQYFEEALDAFGIKAYVYKGLGFFDAPEVQDLQALIRYLAQPDSNLRAAELLRSRLVRLSDGGLACLAPNFADAILACEAPAAAASLDSLDAALLQHVRTGASRWLELADRVPPSALLDVVLSETGYAYEWRGRRCDQARENVKKIRALVRRVENRGYATVGRLASYFDTLRAGDDANAVVEASGAVNLMTMHAAKGLEFPIVFLVNLQAPGRGVFQSVSIVEDGPAGEPDVSFGSSDATRLEEQREAEELRRLLYVAVTRARDRLYLCADVVDGAIRKQARSLASLLPESLLAAYSAAAASPDGADVLWDSGSGTFAFRACRAPTVLPRHVPETARSASAESVLLTSVASKGPAIATWTDVTPQSIASAGIDDADPFSNGTTGGEDRRLVGTTVHRMFQRAIDPDAETSVLGQQALDVLTWEERVTVADPEAFAVEAVRLYRVLWRQPGIRGLLSSPSCLHEVPFAYRPRDRPDVIVRGIVDCVVIEPDGSATVVELKTGAARPEHRVQAEFYGRAMAAALGVTDVRIRVIYPDWDAQSG